MKHLWFLGCLVICIKGAILTYLAASGAIDGVKIQHIAASGLATIFMGYGMYLFWPCRDN